MKTIRMSMFTTCVLLLAGVAGAQTVTVQNTADYQDNGWLDNVWFVEPGAILDHYPFCRGSNQDWGWTHDLNNSIPRGATGIQSASITIYTWKIDVEDGEDDVIYVLPEKPAIVTSSGIVREGTELGLLKSYLESPTTFEWSAEGQVNGYENFWSVTTFVLPADVIADLWDNGELYFHVDIDQTGYEGLRATLARSVLRVTYFAPEPEAPEIVAVHRFWSPLLSSHFYTTNEVEVQGLITEYAWAWTYEGIAYHAMAEDADWRAAPVHRFWSPLLSGHFYTINEAEANYILANYPSDVWTYEGIAWYAFPAGSQPVDAMPVYRFWSPLVSHHFYTMNAAEKDYLLANYPPEVWTYEGIAWYAYEP